MSHTKGPWEIKRFSKTHYAIEAGSGKKKVIVALCSGAGLDAAATDKERFANMRLIEQAPNMFDSIGLAHDLSLDGHHKEAREVLRHVLSLIEEERLPEGYL